MSRRGTPFFGQDASINFVNLSTYLNDVDVSTVDIVTVPSTATSAGKAGQIAYNTTHLYICVDKDVWRRVSISSW